jgi:replicative DNA helicase
MTASTAVVPEILTGPALFEQWTHDLLNGGGSALFPHGLPVPEISPGRLTLLGGAPGVGKTAFVTQCVVEAMRHTTTLRVLIANVEMPAPALLTRQLARLSGITGEAIRQRHSRGEYADRIACGQATIEALTDRIAFMQPPFTLEKVLTAADAHEADLIVLDYLQRFTPITDSVDARVRMNEAMDLLRKVAFTGCAVLAVSAVSRARDKGGRPTYAAPALTMASFRESSELEYGADDAFLLAPVKDENPSVVRLSHLKCRHGKPRTIDLHFDRACQSFTLMSEVDTTAPNGSRTEA